MSDLESSQGVRGSNTGMDTCAFDSGMDRASHRAEERAVTDPDEGWEGFLAMGRMLGSKDWLQSALRKRVVIVRNSLRAHKPGEQKEQAHLGTEQMWSQRTNFRRQEMRLTQAEYH